MGTGSRLSEVRISDLEHMGGEVIWGRMVFKTMLSRKYEGKLKFGNASYFVYIRQSFLKGARLSGIAAPLYQNREYALLACIRLNDAYHQAVQNNTNDIFRKRKKRIWGEIAVCLIVSVVLFFYVQRAVMVAQSGMSKISFILSILYPVIVALCYIIHYRLQ